MQIVLFYCGDMKETRFNWVFSENCENCVKSMFGMLDVCTPRGFEVVFDQQKHALFSDFNWFRGNGNKMRFYFSLKFHQQIDHCKKCVSFSFGMRLIPHKISMQNILYNQWTVVWRRCCASAKRVDLSNVKMFWIWIGNSNANLFRLFRREKSSTSCFNLIREEGYQKGRTSQKASWEKTSCR